MLFDEEIVSLPSVRNFNLERYLGRWYEIARLPHRAERGMEFVHADYFIQDDELLIRSYGSRAGKLHKFDSCASLLKASAGEFKVRFLAPWRGEFAYRILFTDPEYRYSVAGTPDRNYLWIMARTPVLSLQHLGTLREFAGFHGFEVDQLEYPTQSKSIV